MPIHIPIGIVYTLCLHLYLYLPYTYTYPIPIPIPTYAYTYTALLNTEYIRCLYNYNNIYSNIFRIFININSLLTSTGS